MGVKDQIFKLAKKGLTPSQIGVILRDSHGVAQVRFITGNKILRILKGKGMAPALPEDCYYLIKKAVSIRKHLERNRKDKDAKFRLILVESRIHRLARYYKTKDQIFKLAKKGLTPSQIGVILRDSHGVAQIHLSRSILLVMYSKAKSICLLYFRLCPVLI